MEMLNTWIGLVSDGAVEPDSVAAGAMAASALWAARWIGAVMFVVGVFAGAGGVLVGMHRAEKRIDQRQPDLDKEGRELRISVAGNNGVKITALAGTILVIALPSWIFGVVAWAYVVAANIFGL